MAAPLYADRHPILEAIRTGSPVPRADDVADLLERTLAVAERKAQNGPTNARNYSAKVEAGIASAIGWLAPGVLPANAIALRTQQVLDRIARTGPEAFGLRKMPDIETVRRVIRKMRVAESLSIEPQQDRREHSGTDSTAPSP